MSATTGTSSPAEVRAPVVGRDAEILTPEVLGFVAALRRGLARSARGCSPRARARQAELDAGTLPAFLPETQAVRDGDWQVAPAPAELQDRRVEITGPVERKMVINAAGGSRHARSSSGWRSAKTSSSS